MEVKTAKQRTCSIDLFRYLCAVMVVIIHSTFWQSWGDIGFFIGNIFPRIAVPFFFAVSGYFYIKGLERGKKVFGKQMKHLLSIYSIWSIVYFLLSFLNQLRAGSLNLLSFLKDCLFFYLVLGSYGHFWFFPAIIISTCLVTLFYKAKITKALLPISIGLYIVGCLGCSYFGLGSKIPLLGALLQHSSFTTIRRIFLMGFPFFVSGGVLLKLDALRERKFLPLLWLGTAVVFVAEICLVSYFALAENVIISFALYPLLLLTLLLLFKYPMAHCTRSASICRSIANFTYYAHPLMVTLLTEGLLLLGISVANLVVFLWTVLSCLFVGLVCHFLVTKKNIKLVKLFIG